MEAKAMPLELGLVSDRADAMLNCYRGLLGFEDIGQTPLPGTGTIHRLQSGIKIVKLLLLDRPPQHPPREIPFTATTGLRYFTLWVDDLAGIVDACPRYGCRVLVPPRALNDGLSVAMITDPDGNTIEMMTGV